MPNAMESLLLRGAVFRTSISIPSGKRKLNRARLNLPTTIENDKLVTSGSLIIIPVEEMAVFHKIRAKANGIIESFGVNMGSIGLLVPNERIEQVNNDLEGYQREFSDAIIALQNKFPEVRQAQLSLWNQEIVTLAAQQSTEESFIFDVMRALEAEFHEWGYFAGKFSFSWREFHDINDMAEAFIEDSIKTIIERMREFAEGLVKRLQDEKISERNIAPVRRWVESIGMAVRSFENERLNRMVETLESWTEFGVDSEVRNYSNAADNMRSMLEDVIVQCNEHVDEITSESIQGLTKQGRVIQRRAS